MDVVSLHRIRCGGADDALKQGPLLWIAFFDLLIQLLVSPKSTWCTGWRSRRANWCFFLKNERNFRITSETGRTALGEMTYLQGHIVRMLGSWIPTPGQDVPKQNTPTGEGWWATLSLARLDKWQNDAVEWCFCLQVCWNSSKRCNFARWMCV